MPQPSKKKLSLLMPTSPPLRQSVDYSGDADIKAFFENTPTCPDTDGGYIPVCQDDGSRVPPVPQHSKTNRPLLQNEIFIS